MDFVELGRVKVSEAVRLVPADGEDVEGDLSADRVLEVEVSKLLAHCFDHRLANVVDLVVVLEGITLGAATVATDGRNIEHASAELDEGASATTTTTTRFPMSDT